MTRIIKDLLINIFWRILFDNIHRIDFTEILNNLSAYIRTLNVREQIRTLNLLITENILENPTLRPVFQPFEVDFTVVLSTWPRKLFFLGFIFTTVVNVWFIYFKRILLLPFKLGIFSFLFSIFGFDVTWFLNLFNIFNLNIPYWVYFQYLTLHNNWLNWWNKTVNVKGITSVPIKEIKQIKQNVTEDLMEVEKKNNKVLYVVGIITVVISIGFVIWYFDIFNYNNPGPGSSSNSTNSPNSPNPGSNGTVTVSNTGDEIPIINLTDRQTTSNPPAASSYSANDVVQEMNRRYDEFSNASTSSTSSRPDPTLNRFNVLDRLDQENPYSSPSRPDSPTLSTDSGDTITPSKPFIIWRRK